MRFELFTARLDGTGNRLLPLKGHLPDWSPDGKRLAFARTNLSGRSSLWTAGWDGSSPSRLQPTRDAIESLAWSPDGQRIAFSMGDEDGRFWIRVIALDGGVVRLGPGTAPTWSPDGKHIAFIGLDGDVKLMRADGSGRRTLVRPAASASSLDFSPDGRRLLFDQARRRRPPPALNVINLRSGKVRALPVTGAVLAAAWAPSGKRIAYLWERRGSGDATQVWTIRADGSRRTRRFTLPGDRWGDGISWQPVPAPARSARPARSRPVPRQLEDAADDGQLEDAADDEPSAGRDAPPRRRPQGFDRRLRPFYLTYLSLD